MNNYWKAHYDSISKQFDGSLLKQVGKTVDGREIPQSQLTLIGENIANVLQLDVEDSVIDLCCGNGLITRQLAPLVKQVIGVDFTLGLIDAAKKYNNHPNIEYVNCDVLELAQDYLSGLKKIVMYEAAQHFSSEQLAKLLTKLSCLGPGSLVFVGSIPNKKQLTAYYDTEEKYNFYLMRENEGKPHIGQWWSMEEIEQLVSKCGFRAEFIPQETMLYTAYYRFDVLLEKDQ